MSGAGQKQFFYFEGTIGSDRSDRELRRKRNGLRSAVMSVFMLNEILDLKTIMSTFYALGNQQ